jgi:hypothetical protein
MDDLPEAFGAGGGGGGGMNILQHLLGGILGAAPMGPPDAPGGIYAEGIHGGGQEDDHEPSPSERAAAAAEARMRGDRDGGDAGARSEGGGSGRRRADWSGFTVTGMRDNGGVAFTYNFGGPGAGGREGGARRDGDGAPEAPAQNLARQVQVLFLSQGTASNVLIK